MEDYYYIILAFSSAVVLMAYVPILLKKVKMSYTVPIVFLGLLFYCLGVPVDWPEPIWANKYVKIITEVIVIISLMGAGLKIGMRYGLRHWKNPLRLIHTTMPLYTLILFLTGRYLLNLDGASALLLAAVCAPTDPVLASELQLQKEEMDKGKNTGMRYLLTAEAGLNDGIAFPFVFFAILWSKANGFVDIDLWHWTGYYFFFKILGGIIIGCIVGYLFSYSIKMIQSNYSNDVLSGFVGIALAFASFSLAEVLGTYGFLSTFFAGLFAQYHYHLEKRQNEEYGPGDEGKQEILLFNEELEVFLIILWTLVFGGFIATGILGYTSMWGMVTALLAILVIRPLTGRIGLMGTKFSEKKKWAIGFFGIKGVGSFFYLTFALYEGNFSTGNELYAIVSYVVVFSILFHGTSGPWVVDYFKRNDPG